MGKHREVSTAPFSLDRPDSPAPAQLRDRDLRAVTIGTNNQANSTLSLAPADRTLGVVLAGQTGFGKTTLMEHFIAEDMHNHTTCLVFDPHGELSERVLRIGAAQNSNNILFCEIGGSESYGFNPLEVKDISDPLEESQTIDSLMQVFRKHWADNPAYAFGSRVEWVLSSTARTILANPGYTLAEIPLLFSDKALREKLTRNVINPQVQQFWGWFRQLEATRRPIDQWQLIESTISRLSQFLANEWLYRVLYQARGTIQFHTLINSGKTIIFSLPVGKLGEQPASLLGSLLLGKLATTIFGRNEYGKKYPRVHIYIDEYSRFATQLISSALFTQARKFNVGTTITLQTLSQIKDEESRAAILQSGNLIAFQLIGSDAETIAKQMPLPDPVSLMKPEPILLYSQTPVEDIWRKGHPNKTIKEIRDEFYWIVGEAEKAPPKDYYRYDWQTRALAEHPQWHSLNDWDWFCSSRDMLRRAIALLNTYLYGWMNHEYSLQEETEDELRLLLEIVECVSGMMGMRPTMQPCVSQVQQAFLHQRLQDYAEHTGEKQGWINSRTGEKDWRLKKLEESISGAIPDVLYPSLLAHTLEMAIAIGMSQYEIDRLIDWQARPLSHKEANSLKAAVRLFMDVTVLPRLNTDEALISQPAFMDYAYHLYVLGLGLISDDDNTFKDVYKREAKYDQIVKNRAWWQVTNLCRFISLGCRLAGYLLEKEPVFDTSHVYKDVEYNRRTYSDLREELVTKLVSLPPYQAIVHLAGQGTDLPVQILTPSPLPINADAEPKANAVREESRRKLGHPWQEVVKDIQTRQNLPPAKPQI